jgi:peptidoglycan/LPS O-acetylase OafA/YrhL
MTLPTALIALWVISHAAVGVRGWVGWAMSFPPSVYLGRISYGIYVYHLFVPDVLKPFLRRVHIKEGGVAFVLACFVVTIGVASLSWFLLERPFNALKDRYARSVP